LNKSIPRFEGWNRRKSLVAIVSALGLASLVLVFALSSFNTPVSPRQNISAQAVSLQSGICGTAKPLSLLLPAAATPNLTRFQSSTSNETAFQSPILTAPAYSQASVGFKEVTNATETLVSTSAPSYVNSGTGLYVMRHPAALVAFDETVTGFRHVAAENRLFVLDNTPYSESGLSSSSSGVNFANVQSNLFSIPNSIFSLKTSLPNAPTLIVETFRTGSTIINFGIYGGPKLTVRGTSQIVNKALNRLTSMCPGGQLVRTSS
jgi:hypothetical protein